MPAQENQNVFIVSWPKDTARVEHTFHESPCPVSISFDQTPARVVVQSDPDRPLAVDMTMNVVAKEAIAICHRLCEPICAKSEYTIGIEIFDRPVAAITIRGLTRFFNCREE